MSSFDVPGDTSLEKLWALRRLSEQPFDRQEQEILQQLHRKGNEAVQHFIQRFGFSRISVAVHRWHTRFRKSLSPEPPFETVLCAFTSVRKHSMISIQYKKYFIIKSTFFNFNYLLR